MKMIYNSLEITICPMEKDDSEYIDKANCDRRLPLKLCTDVFLDDELGPI